MTGRLTNAGTRGDVVALWLAGDVMTGRGIDQVMARHCDVSLHEPWVRDAREYVRLAERAHGPIPAPVDPAYIWGDALEEIERRSPDVRLVNLETAITSGGVPCSEKDVHYRMHPANVGCLSAARIDCCAMANNHALDWGVDRLGETLRALDGAAIRYAGAGADIDAASAPAVLPLAGGGRLLVFAWATADSGVPADWGATTRRPGVALLNALDESAAGRVAAQVARWRQPGDRVVLSMHWGDNWGVEVPAQQRRFAHRLIELDAADLVHGHSSHHPRPIEVYRGRLILYGCGDLINDYEGIGREGRFDPSIVCLYFAQISRSSGELAQLRIVPMQLRRLRLVRADDAATQQLRALLDGRDATFGSGLRAQPDGGWLLAW